jgi:hypothetical protein
MNHNQKKRLMDAKIVYLNEKLVLLKEREIHLKKIVDEKDRHIFILETQLAMEDINHFEKFGFWALGKPSSITRRLFPTYGSED